MTRLAICLLLLATLAGCEPMTPAQTTQKKLVQPFHDVTVEHDDARGVTCWVPRDGRAGLSCLPDWMLKKLDPAECMTIDLKSEACQKLFRGNAGNERQLSPHEQQDNGPTPAQAPARWNEERYSL